jgi:hypothetical protein
LSRVQPEFGCLAKISIYYAVRSQFRKNEILTSSRLDRISPHTVKCREIFSMKYFHLSVDEKIEAALL